MDNGWFYTKVNKNTYYVYKAVYKVVDKGGQRCIKVHNRANRVNRSNR